MSQINKIILSSSGGGDVLTLTGNTGGAVGPDGGGNINVIGDGTTASVAGNAGTNTLTISVAGAQVDTVTTLDATETTLGTITLSANEIVFITSQIIGAYETAINWAFGTSLMTTARKQGAASPVIVEGTIDERARAKTNGTDAGVNATYDVSGNTVRIRVTGEAGTTIAWKSITTVLRQSAP